MVSARANPILSTVASLAAGVAAHQSVAATVIEALATRGAGLTAIPAMRHGSDLGISDRLRLCPQLKTDETKRDQQLALVAAGFAEDLGAADAQRQVGLLETDRAV